MRSCGFCMALREGETLSSFAEKVAIFQIPRIKKLKEIKDCAKYPVGRNPISEINPGGNNP